MTAVNGHANGASAPPRFVTLAPITPPPEIRQDGPVSPWPMRQEDDRKADRKPAIDGDDAIRYLTAAVVLAVASFAAVVSYSHIFDLAHRHGQDGTAARLLPLSIDGLIAAASLVMLHAGRNKLPVPPLSRGMLWTGIAATVAANVLYAIPGQWIGPAASVFIGAAISAFPAVAFIGSVEMMIRFVRDARTAATAPADITPERDSDDDTEDDSDPPSLPPDDVTSSDTKPPPDKPDRRQRTPSGRAKAIAIMKRSPALSDAEVARKAGVSERTVQRARQALAGLTTEGS